ncbi:MAG: glycosyltransferase family 39 protein [Caulobacteraceae bacterium]|nr:glycosyltransferase family 39 protein [Caulobacteraceae bacterium]
MTAAASPPPGQDAFYARAALWLTLALTLARILALFATPLELHPDEAQYWLWSRELAFGYYSKPPLIAWAIWATTQIGGDAEPWVRLSAALFHAVATLAVFALGRRLYDSATGFWAAVFYALMPGVQLSSLVIATDAPLLLFYALALLAYARFLADGGWRWAALLGLAVGAGFLAKYAAVYALVGLALHAALSREARGRWRLPAGLAAAGAFALVLAPNVLWNLQHGFATVQHTAANAGWEGRLFNPGKLAEFLASQFGVFGPLPFAVLIGGAGLLAARRRLQPADLMLLCFALPPFAIVAAQAFINRANANWSGAGYVAGAVLVAAWLVRWRAKRWLIANGAFQAGLAVLFLVMVVSPPFADRIGAGNSFKRVKGWAAMTDSLLARARQEPGLTAVAVDDRFLFNAAAYYGRRAWAEPGVAPLVMWVREIHPLNQAETERPLTRANGGRVLAASLIEPFRQEFKADFVHTSGREIVSVTLDGDRRKRRMELFVGEGFSPRPRDPATGLPTPP